MAVWLQAKVRGRGLGLLPRPFAGSVMTAPLRRIFGNCGAIKWTLPLLHFFLPYKAQTVTITLTLRVRHQTVYDQQTVDYFYACQFSAQNTHGLIFV